AQQLGQILRARGGRVGRGPPGYRETDSSLHADPIVVEQYRCVQSGVELAGSLLSRYGTGQIHKQDGELVTTQPGNEIARAGQPSQTSGDLGQDTITGREPVRLIDLLELAEVDEDQTGGQPIPP